MKINIEPLGSLLYLVGLLGAMLGTLVVMAMILLAPILWLLGIGALDFFLAGGLLGTFGPLIMGVGAQINKSIHLGDAGRVEWLRHMYEAKRDDLDCLLWQRSR